MRLNSTIHKVNYLYLSLILFTASGFTPGQSFQISHVPAEYFSLDKFNHNVYYAQIGTWDLYVKNLEDSTILTCPFPTLPVFANKSHKCVYGDQDSIFVFDFETGNSIKICESVGGPYGALGYEFSPNDEYVLFREHYYSFADSSLHLIDFTPDPYLQMEWVTETKFVWFFDDYLIASFDILANELDTVLVSNSNLTYAAFAFNKSSNLLYYALSEIEYPKIHSYDLLTQNDSIVFDTENDTNDLCWLDLNNLREMEWSPDSSRMAFFSYILEAGGTIYTYVPDDERLYKYTVCGGEGYESHLKWLNNDTIVYFNATLGYIYGFVLDDPLAVKEDKSEVVLSTFEISAYPNPFNGVVHFNLTGAIKEPELLVYNINGQEVVRIENLRGSDSKFTATWNGRNSDGVEVSSGVYFAIIRDKNNPLSIKGASKIIYLK